MKHEIDTSKYQIRTDLAIDNINEKIKPNKKTYKNITINSIHLDKETAQEINKKEGNYITIEFEDITDKENKKNVTKTLTQELKKIIEKDKSCLIIGLGNSKSTPDALGPKTIDKILVTNHLYELGNLQNGYRRVSALNPGVMGETGIETSDIVKSVVDKIKPDFLIVIDALASSSLNRINKTIQITDTGIHPGSGIGNNRKEISKETLGIPVIAIGVPTTVDAVTIVSDTIKYMSKKFIYTKQNIENPMNKLIINNTIDYSKKNIKVTKKDKQELLGLVGQLNEEETKKLIEEVLNPIGYNFIVTPKEIDFLIIKLSDILSEGINLALHENYK